MNTSKVTRIEIINHTSKGKFGRAFVYWSEYDNGIENPTVQVVLQDDDRTLKIFIGEK